MLNPKLFEVLKKLDACPESIEYLKTQTDPAVAVRGLRPSWKDWIAETAELPCWKKARKAYNEALATAYKTYQEAKATAWKAFDGAIDGEILTWYYQL
jgi:hypothetical protein